MRIAVDFSRSNEPILEILIDHESADIRDQLLKSFCQSLGGGSNILKIEFDNTASFINPSKARYVIRAIPPHRNLLELEHPELDELRGEPEELPAK
ncbi:MAG TPA: hypothetical protein VFM18_08615 [Methanosarcina sp.]|nr:hypothetical protein [Methanosarcina sp.]